jgi:hypothetical protein
MLNVREAIEVLVRAGEDALPNSLDKIHRVKLRPQSPGKPTTNHHPNIVLKTMQEIAGGLLVTRLDPSK